MGGIVAVAHLQPAAGDAVADRPARRRGLWWAADCLSNRPADDVRSCPSLVRHRGELPIPQQTSLSFPFALHCNETGHYRCFGHFGLCRRFRLREPRTPMTGLTPIADRRDDRRHGARSKPAVTGIQAIHLRASVPPTAVIAVVGVGIVVFVLVRGASTVTVRLVVAAAVVAVGLVLLAAIYAASAATRQMSRQITAVRSVAVRGQAELARLVEEIHEGKQPVPRIRRPPASRTATRSGCWRMIWNSRSTRPSRRSSG